MTLTGSQLRTLLELRSTWFTPALLALAPAAKTITYGGAVSLTGFARGVDGVSLEAKTAAQDWTPVGDLLLDGEGAFATVRQAAGGDAVPPRLRHGPRRAREDRRRAAGRRTGDRRRCSRDDPPGARPARPCSCSSSRARPGRRLRAAPPTPAAPSASPRRSRRAPIASAAYRATASRPASLLRSRCRETAARARGRGTRARAARLVARVRQHRAARGEAVVPRAGQRVVLLAGATEAVPDPGRGDRLGHRRRPSGSDGARRRREVVRRRLALPRHAGSRHVRRRGDRREPVQQRGDRRARVQRAARDREGRPGETARSRSKARWRRSAGRSTRARA